MHNQMAFFWMIEWCEEESTTFSTTTKELTHSVGSVTDSNTSIFHSISTCKDILGIFQDLGRCLHMLFPPFLESMVNLQGKVNGYWSLLLKKYTIWHLLDACMIQKRFDFHGWNWMTEIILEIFFCWQNWMAKFSFHGWNWMSWMTWDWIWNWIRDILHIILHDILFFKQHLYINPSCAEHDYSQFTQKILYAPAFASIWVPQRTPRQKSSLVLLIHYLCKTEWNQSDQYLSSQIHIEHMVSIKNTKNYILSLLGTE